MPQTDEPGVLNRYQRAILYGLGVVVSIILALLTCVVLYGMVKDYIGERYTEFAVRKTQMQLEFLSFESAVRAGILLEDSAWGVRNQPPKSLVSTFAAQNGRIVLQGSTNFKPMLVLGEITPLRPARSFAPYLAFADEFDSRVGAYAKARRRSLSGYLYSPDRSFLAIIPAPKDGDPLVLNGANNVDELLRRIAPDIGDLADPAVVGRLLETRAPIWSSPVVDPFSREPAIRLVQPGFSDDKPFIVFVRSLPVRLLSGGLDGTRYDEASLILDAAGKVILTTENSGIAGRVLTAKPWLTNTTERGGRYLDGLFIIGDRVTSAGWMLVYAFSWRTIAAELWPRGRLRRGYAAGDTRSCGRS